MRWKQGTGIRFHLGYLYASSNNAVYRFAFNANDLVPAAAPEAIVTGLPNSNHAIAFDEHGGLYVSVDSGGNICTDPKAPKEAKPVGLKPCPLWTAAPASGASAIENRSDFCRWRTLCHRHPQHVGHGLARQ